MLYLLILVWKEKQMCKISNHKQEFPEDKDDESDDLRQERPQAQQVHGMATGEEYRESILRLF